LVRVLAVNPARLIGVARGSLQVGAAADLTVVDPDAVWVYDATTAQSQARNSPFWGERLTGRATDCLVGGQIRLRDCRILQPSPARAGEMDVEALA
jgi:dihydroorotase